MKFRCELDNIKTLKKGMKITLTIDDKQTIEVMKNIYNFMDKAVMVDISVDEDTHKERLKQITGEQRKKIYGLIKDIASYTGENKDNLKDITKDSFIKSTEYEEFSLSNCSKELAAAYIDYLITLAFELGVSLSENPAEGLENIESYLTICLQQKKCCVCGLEGEIHHVDTIGMGRDRNTVDDSDYKKICLCREHHTEYHKIGQINFENKYHVYGI